MMQRHGHLKYSATAGRYRADANSDSKEPEFAEATAIYGLNNTFTLYGGLLSSEDYYALGIGIGGTLGALGALSMDINRADTQFDNRRLSWLSMAYAVHQRYPGNQHQYRC